MMFYRITAKAANLKAAGTDDQTKRLFDELRNRAEKYGSRGADYLFLSNFIHDRVTAGAIIQSGKPRSSVHWISNMRIRRSRRSKESAWRICLVTRRIGI